MRMISLLARLPRPHISWQMRADNRFVTAKDLHQDCFRLLIVIMNHRQSNCLSDEDPCRQFSHLISAEMTDCLANMGFFVVLFTTRAKLLKSNETQVWKKGSFLFWTNVEAVLPDKVYFL